MPSAPVAARPPLLRAALAFAPEDALRLELFHAEAAAGESERALATVQPLLGSYSPGYVNGRYGRYAYYAQASAAEKTTSSLAADLSIAIFRSTGRIRPRPIRRATRQPRTTSAQRKSPFRL